jgi:hypothetical protein
MTALAAACGWRSSLTQLPWGQARSSTVRSATNTSAWGRPVGVAGHQLIQQRPVRLGDAGMQQPCGLTTSTPGGWLGSPAHSSRPQGAVRHPAHAPPCWGGLSGSGCRPQPYRRGSGVLLDVGLRRHPLMAECGTAQEGGHDHHPLSWLPSRFLADRAEPERAFALVVVVLNSESRARKPTRAWAIIRRADGNHRLADQRASRPDRRPTDRADRTSRSQQAQGRETVAGVH